MIDYQHFQHSGHDNLDYVAYIIYQNVLIYRAVSVLPYISSITSVLQVILSVSGFVV